MKSFVFGLITLVSFALGALTYAAPNADPGKPGLPSPATTRTYLNQGYGFPPQLGVQVVDHKLQLAKGGWSVVKNGGASVVLPSTALANLTDVDGKDLRLPYHAIIKRVFVDVITPPSASATAGFTAPQLGLGLDSAGDLYSYAAHTTFTKGVHVGTPIATTGTMIKVGNNAGANTAGSTVKLNMKGGSVVTNGQFNVFIEYYLSD